jgi:transposase-like protein
MATNKNQSSAVRVFRGRARIQQLLEAYDASGLSQKEFCRQHGVCLSTFTYWLKTRRKDATGAPKGFRPVRVVPGAVTQGTVVRLPCGIEVVLPAGSSARDVAQLITLLRPEASC